MNSHERERTFIDRDKLYGMIDGPSPSEADLQEILNKALRFKGLGLTDVASLLRVIDPAQIHAIMETARIVKDHIYGKRLVLFAPLYTGNACVNNCLYCAFRKDNTAIKRK